MKSTAWKWLGLTMLLVTVFAFGCANPNRATRVNELQKAIQYPGAEAEMGQLTVEGIKSFCLVDPNEDYDEDNRKECKVDVDVAWAKVRGGNCSGNVDVAIYSIGGHMAPYTTMMNPTLIAELDKTGKCYEIYSMRNYGYCVGDEKNRTCTEVKGKNIPGDAFTAVWNARIHDAAFKKLSEQVQASWIIDGSNFGGTVVYEMLLNGDKATYGNIHAMVLKNPWTSDFMSSCETNAGDNREDFDEWYKGYDDEEGELKAKAWWMTSYIADKGVYAKRPGEDQKENEMELFCQSADKTEFNMNRYWKKVNELGLWFKVYFVASLEDVTANGGDLQDMMTDWEDFDMHKMGYGCLINFGYAGQLPEFDYPQLYTQIIERKGKNLGYRDSDGAFQPCKWLVKKKASR